jgi:hypothetical protein
MNTEAAAREILGSMIRPDNSLTGILEWVSWPQYSDPSQIGLDGTFTAGELEAMAWWMRNMQAPE